MNTSSKSPERVFSAICTNGVFRIRMRAAIGPQNASFNRTGSRASAHFPSVASVLAGRNGQRTAIERTQPLAVLAVRALQQGTCWIFNSCWPFKASSSLSFGSFVKHRQEPASVQNVLFSPEVLSCLPFNHDHTRAWSNERDAQKNSASGA